MFVRAHSQPAASRANGDDLIQYANTVSLRYLFCTSSLSLDTRRNDPLILYNVLWLAMFPVIVQLFFGQTWRSHVRQKRYFAEESTFLSLSSISCMILCLFCGAKRLQNTQTETATSFCYHHTHMHFVTTYVCSLRQGNGLYCGRLLAWESKGKRLTRNKLFNKTTRNYR